MARGKLTLDSISKGRSFTVADYEDSTFDTPALREKIQRKRRIRVKTSLLVFHDKNGFKVTDDENFEELVAVVKKDGISNTIVATEQPDGTYKVLSGERRSRAALAAGLEEVEIWSIPQLTPSEELSYMTRENLGGRGDDPFGKALMIYYYNQEQEKLPEEERISAGEAMKFKRSSYLEYSLLAVMLGEDLLLYGQEGLFTREFGVTLAKIVRDHPTVGKRMKAEILDVCNDSSINDSEKSKKLKEILAGRNKEKEQTKKINVFNSVKKVKSLVGDLSKPEASLPLKKERREELKKMAEDTIKDLERLIDSL